MTHAAIIADFSLDKLLAIAVIGAVAGVYWFYKGFRLLQRKRLILNTPSSKIRSASMGLVEISGLATGPYVMISPLKQVECYYYRSIAWELKQRGKNSEWVKVAEETLHVPFYVDDGTDKVLVDPRGVEMDLNCDFQEQYNRSLLFDGPEMPGCVSHFLLRHAANPDKRIKVEEYCVKPHNSLFVLGTLSQNPGLDASVMPAWAERAGFVAEGNGSEPFSQEVIRLSTDTVPVCASDMTQQQKIAAALLKAGVTSPAAWAVAGVGGQSPMTANTMAASSVQAATAVEEKPDPASIAGFDLHPPVILMKGCHDPAFFISWRSQRDVVNSLGWKSTLMIWGGPALTLASTYFVLEHLGWL
jgi:E3 Ubiquitin ligase